MSRFNLDLEALARDGFSVYPIYGRDGHSIVTFSYARGGDVDTWSPPVPASDPVSVPSYALKQDDLEDEKVDAECPICIDEYGLGDMMAKLSCGHCFHQQCIELWLSGPSKTCPQCRAAVL